MWADDARGVNRCGFRSEEPGSSIRAQARRCGANPSPRSWPRICSCKCSGWHFEEMPGEVRPASRAFSKKAGTVRRLPAADAGRSLPHFVPVQQCPAPHPTSLREATQSICSANAGPASWRGIRAAPSRLTEMCANRCTGMNRPCCRNSRKTPPSLLRSRPNHGILRHLRAEAPQKVERR